MKVTACLYCGHQQLSQVTYRSDNVGIIRCAKCGIMMVAEISDNTEQLYTAEYFEKKEDTKSGYTSYLSSPVANLIGKYAFTRLFAQQLGAHLDLGCADGSLMEIFRSEGFTSRGLEISQDAVAIARTKGLDVTFSHLHGFPVKLATSNVITAFDLLEHADQPRTVLKDVYQNLEPNGYFVFSTLSVKKTDPTDYWFNHSLEHYIYYDRAGLDYALTEIFGADNFSFIEIEINGIAEFWGFAKKGKLTGEQKILAQVESGNFDKADADTGYLVSLFYNQLSKFADSRHIITHFADEWSQDKLVQAEFYNYYFQGKFEKAIAATAEKLQLVSIQNGAFWQALNHAETTLASLHVQDVTKALTQEVLEQRDQTFRLRDELHAMKNARVLGKIIKARDKIGAARHKTKDLHHLPKRSVHKLRVVVAPLVPPKSRKLLKRAYKQGRSLAGKYRVKSTVYHSVINQPWEANLPLVSVVIPYFNHGHTIDETVASLQAQTFRNFEVILVNDGSTDQASLDKLASLKQSFKAQFIDQANQGVAAARNAGIKQARGKYIICLDSDDILEPTYMEKATLVLETEPDTALVTCNIQMFGVLNEPRPNSSYNPLELYSNNMVITAAEFRRQAWATSGGYKSDIGYEDWEFWLNLAEHGYWGRRLDEYLFRYRTSMQSRYVGDKDVHWNTLKNIRSLHAKYKTTIKNLQTIRRAKQTLVEPASAFVNLAKPADFMSGDQTGAHILITIPWMTFGGAETLIYNYCREIKDKFNLSFVTGLDSKHEWEYKFRELTPYIYHLPGLFEDQRLYMEFISNYITTHQIDILHVIHNGFTFEMLAELKRRHPRLKIAVTMFNDRVEYFEQSVNFANYIDSYTTDNQAVAKHYRQLLPAGKRVSVIPNGINCYDEFSPALFDRAKQRLGLGIAEDELAIFFVGRLSEEKNPDVFLEVAKQLLASNKHKLRFFIIGDGPARPQVEKMMKELASDKVIYLGYQAKVAEYLSAADVFVLPSSIEGFPLSILEAMAMRVAVIASDVGAVSDVIESGIDGFVVPAGSAKDIATTLQKLSSDPKLLEMVKTKARQKVEKKYSNIILGHHYQQAYNELLA